MPSIPPAASHPDFGTSTVQPIDHRPKDRVEPLMLDPLMVPYRALTNFGKSLRTLPERAIRAAGEFNRDPENADVTPILDTAMLMVGSPLAPAKALGSAARRPPRRLPMDEESRMARADEMGFRRELPVEYGSVPAGEKIAAAAIDVNAHDFSGPTHAAAIERAEQALGVPFTEMQHGPFVDGFVTNTGRYVSRWEATDIAGRTGQGHARGSFGATRGLASEDTALSGVRPSSKVQTGATASGLPGGQGVWGWVLPGEAASTPTLPAGRQLRQPVATDRSGPYIPGSEEAAVHVGPKWHRTARPGSMDASGLADYEIRASLKEAWDRGCDAVMLRNYTAPGGRSEVETFWW